MPQSCRDWKDVSLLVFGLRLKDPDLKFYVQLREHIHNHQQLKHIVPVIQEFPKILSSLASDLEIVASWLSQTTYANDLVEWISGRENNIAEVKRGYVVLPLLALIQLTQYLNFLKEHNVDHCTFVSHIRKVGGVQGYCGGLPCGLAVASACSEADLVRKFAVSIRLAFLIGIMGEVADDPQDGFEMMVIRLAYPGQREQILDLFPGVEIVAITDPRSIAVSGRSQHLSSLSVYVKQHNMYARQWPLQGKWHHPQNLGVAQKLSIWCNDQQEYNFGPVMTLGEAPRSNYTANCIVEGQFTDELIFGILVHQSDWYEVLKKVARQAQSKRSSLNYHIVNFGVGDCVPVTAFNEFNLPVQKFNAHALLSSKLQSEHVSSLTSELPYTGRMVAIVGASCRFPGASNLAELWELLSTGQDRHRKLDNSRFNISESYRARMQETYVKERSFFANLLDDMEPFDNAFFSINSREAMSMDPQQRIILELAYEAMESCGYSMSHERKRGDVVGCFIGAGAVDYHENTSAYAPSAYTSTGTMRSFISGRISHYFGWTGPSEVIDTACSSSLVAIHRACRSLESGECVMALAGGINILTSPNCFFDLGQAGFLSPTGQCKPFDSTADGYCRADGAGLVALKLLDQARHDGDPILGVIPGSHVNQGGPSSSITIPHSDTQVDLFRHVVQKAKIDAASISYVEAHGTGTQVGDPIEIDSLRKFFNKQRSDIAHVASVKGNIGHSEAAAGVASLLKVIVMLQHRKIPPQANFHVLNPKIKDLAPDGLAIPTRLLDWNAKYCIALINSYGASGANAAVIVRSAPETKTAHTDIASGTISYSQPITFSAATRSSVQKFAKELSRWLSQINDQSRIQDIAFTANSWRKTFRHRIVVNALSTEVLRQKLESRAYDLFDANPRHLHVVLTLSGQNSKTVGLSRVIYNRYHRFRTHLDECNSILTELGYPAIIPAVFSSDDIEDVVVLQTALVASQIAFSLCWLESGIQVSAVLGHSLGELAALAVTSALSIRDCLKLVAYRARLIQTKWGADKGAMLAVSSTSSGLEQLVCEMDTREASDVEVACFNSNTSLVFAGPSAAIHHVEQSLRDRDHGERMRVHRLNVSYGFHSKLTYPILEDLSNYARSLDWKTPKIHLETCSQGLDNAGTLHDPSEHAKGPVFFEKAVQRLEKKFEACAWLEAGMNSKIISLTRKATVKNDEHRFFPVSVNFAKVDAEVVTDTIYSLWREG